MLKSVIISINVCPNTLIECLNSRIYGFLTQFFPCFSQHACQVMSVPYLHFVDTLFQYGPDSKIHGIQVWNVQGPINVLQQRGIIRKILLKEVEQFQAQEWGNRLIELCKCQYITIPLKSQQIVDFIFGLSLENCIFSGWQIQLSSLFVISQFPYVFKMI